MAGISGVSQVGFTSPYAAEEADIERRRRMAELLQAEGQKGLGPTEMVGGWAIPKSPWEGVGKAAQQMSGAYQAKQLKGEEKALSDRYASDAQRVMAQGLRQLQGSPAQPGGSYEDSMGIGREAPGQAAVPGDPMAALGTFGQHPQATALAPLAMTQIQNQQRQSMLANILNGGGAQPGQTVQPGQPGAPQAGAQGPISQAQAMQMIASGDAGLAAMGQAALKQFAIPAAEQAKMDQAAKFHAEPSGSAVLGSQTTVRGQNMTDSRSREAQAETVRHHGAIEGDPTTIENTAQAIASGQLAPLSGFALAKPMGQQIMSRVVSINPAFDPTQFGTRQKAEKDFATGKPGQTVRSFNVALAHLDTLDHLSDALNNGNVQLINKAANAVSTQTGHPAPVNFDAAKKIVADEIVKAIVGSGGGVTDREEAARTISAASSPAQLKGVIGTYKELMRGQLGGLQKQYETSTGKKDFTKFLTETGKAGAGGAQNPNIDAILDKYK